MTAQPPRLKAPPGASRGAEDRHPALSDTERLLYPAWLDRDVATGGPSYLGYVMLLLIAAIIIELIALAIGVAMV